MRGSSLKSIAGGRSHEWLASFAERPDTANHPSRFQHVDVQRTTLAFSPTNETYNAELLTDLILRLDMRQFSCSATS